MTMHSQNHIKFKSDKILRRVGQQLYSSTHSYTSELVDELVAFTPPDTSIRQKNPALTLMAGMSAFQRIWRRDHILPCLESKHDSFVVQPKA